MRKALTAEQEREVADLAKRMGPTLALHEEIPEFHVGDWRPVGSEVCMVIRRPNGNVLTMLKTFYPRGAHRLPTGGVEADEPILSAALREAREETGLDVEVRRLLSRIAYAREGQRDGPPVFHTFAFLLDEVGGVLGALDKHEQVDEFREVAIQDLSVVASRLGTITGETAAVPGDWPAWGRFRAIVHRAVARALM